MAGGALAGGGLQGDPLRVERASPQASAQARPRPRTPPRPAARLQVQSQVRHSGPQASGDVSGSRTVDGKAVVLGGRTLTLWEVATGRQLRTFDTQGGDVQSVVFSPDGRTIASLTDVRLARAFEVVDKVVTLWDVASGQSLRSWPAAARNSLGLAFCGWPQRRADR